MPYTLYNRLNRRRLVHPSCGLWYANEINEAAETYAACLEYLTASGLSEMIPYITVVDAETGEEVNFLTGTRSACRNTSSS